MLACRAKYQIRIFLVLAGARMQPRPRGLFVFQYDGGGRPYWKTRRPWGRAWLGSSFPAPLRSLPPINNSSLKNLNRLSQSRESEINQTVQFAWFVFFFTQLWRSCCVQLGKKNPSKKFHNTTRFWTLLRMFLLLMNSKAHEDTRNFFYISVVKTPWIYYACNNFITSIANMNRVETCMRC